MKTLIQIIVALIFLGMLAIHLLKGAFPVKEPLFVPLLKATQLQEHLQKDQRIIVVLFYHSNTEIPRYYFQVLDQLADKFKDQMSIVRYQLSDQAPDPSFNQYWQGNFLVLFKDGKEVKQQLIQQLSTDKVRNLGKIFLFIKDSLSINWPASNEALSSIPSVDAENFEEKVLNSSKYVVVNFFSNTCPYSKSFNPSFESFAKEHSNLATFYYCDVTDASGKNFDLQEDLTHEFGTPEIVLFYEGKMQARFGGVTVGGGDNEAALWGLLIPYL